MVTKYCFTLQRIYDALRNMPQTNCKYCGNTFQVQSKPVVDRVEFLGYDEEQSTENET